MFRIERTGPSMPLRTPPALAVPLLLAALCVGAAACTYNLTPDDERRFEEYRRQNRSVGMIANWREAARPRLPSSWRFVPDIKSYFPCI